jgi:hypothetical protein
MSRSLDQIFSELNSAYQPLKDAQSQRLAASEKNINDQIGALPGQEATDITTQENTRKKSHNDILSAAISRGLGFSGGTVGEQGLYDTSTFLPATDRIRSTYRQRKFDLTDGLNKERSSINEIMANLIKEQNLKSQEYYGQDQERDAASARARAAAAAANYGFLDNQTPTETPTRPELNIGFEETTDPTPTKPTYVLPPSGTQTVGDLAKDVKTYGASNVSSSISDRLKKAFHLTPPRFY